MTFVYAKDFLGFSNSPATDRIAGPQGKDIYDQVYTYRRGLGDNPVYKAVTLDGTLIFSKTARQLADEVGIIFPWLIGNVSLGSTSASLLTGGEYLLVSFSALKVTGGADPTRQVYALFQVQDGAAPTAIRVFYVTPFQNGNPETTFISGAETYNDPLISISLDGITTSNVSAIVLPSINEILANNYIAWKSDTAAVFATERVPLCRVTFPDVAGQSTAYLFASTGNTVSDNTDELRVFKLPGSNEIHWFVGRGDMSFNAVGAASTTNPWIKNVVEPLNDTALVTIDIGDVSAVAIRPTGTASSNTVSAAPPFVNNGFFETFPTDDGQNITDGTGTNQSVTWPGRGLKFGGRDYWVSVLVPFNAIDRASLQPDEVNVQIIRIGIYEFTAGELILRDVAEGSIFNSIEYGGSTNTALGWDITQIYPEVNPDGELIVVGQTGSSGGNLEPQSVFFTSFGVFTPTGGGGTPRKPASTCLFFPRQFSSIDFTPPNIAPIPPITEPAILSGVEGDPLTYTSGEWVSPSRQNIALTIQITPDTASGLTFTPEELGAGRWRYVLGGVFPPVDDYTYTITATDDEGGVTVTGGNMITSESAVLPAFESAGGTIISNSVTTINVPYPAGIQAGDTLVCSVMHRSTLTVPAGWTKLAETAIFGTFNQRTAMLTKTADGTETGSLTLTQSASNRFLGQMNRLSGIGSMSATTGFENNQPNDLNTDPIASASAAVFVATVSYDLIIPGGVTTNTIGLGWTLDTIEASPDNRLTAGHRVEDGPYSDPSGVHFTQSPFIANTNYGWIVAVFE